jgi:tetratricopeptide (TPR) repeat protein
MRIAKYARYGLVAFTLVVAFGGWSRGAAADDLLTCANESGDVAIAACSRAIASGRYKDRDLAALYGNRGVEYGDKGDLDRALEDFDRAIKVDAKYARAYYNRGTVWSAKRDPDRAIADFGQAIKLDPNYVTAYNSRGSAWSNKGDRDRAIADFDQAIKLDPKFAKAYYNRGLAWERKGELKRALADFKKFAELNPSDPDGPAGVARVTKALNGG